MVATEQCPGFSALPKHQWEKSFHLHSYCARVDGALAFRIVSLTDAEKALNSGLGPAEAKPRAGGGEGRDARSDP